MQPRTNQVELSYAQIVDEIDALEKMIDRMNDSMARGADWLVSQIGPNGPIANARGVSYNHKVCWGLYEEGRLREVYHILEWLVANAQVAPAEYYFKSEIPFDKDMQRIYRFLAFGKVAECLHFKPMTDNAHHRRALKYQHKSGGCFNNIDAGPGSALEPLNTSFLGQWALAAGLMGPAKKAADWLAEMVELNERHMDQDPPTMYYVRDAATGKLVTDVPRNQDMNYYINTVRVKQPSWVTGTAAALLVDVYRVTGEARYLDAALRLAEYETKCSHEQLFWPSKCKVAWGMGQLYAVTGDPVHRRLCANVNRVTFMATQQAYGGWKHVFYPLEERGPWRRVVYGGPRPYVPDPDKLPKHKSYGCLCGQELTGEIMGEMGRSRVAFQEVLARLRVRKAEMEAAIKLKG